MAGAKALEAAGAEGAFVGSRFILSEECPASDATKRNLLDIDFDNLRASMLMGEFDQGVNSVCDTISLVDEIVPAQKIVNEIAGGFGF